MENRIATVIMESTSINQKFKFPDEVIVKSKCIIDIENFTTYENAVSITSEKLDCFECDSTWWTKIYPSGKFTGSLGKSHFDVTIDIKPEEFWKSKKNQYQVSVLTDDRTLYYKSGFKDIQMQVVSEAFQLQRNNILVNTLTGSATFIVNLEFKCLGDYAVSQALSTNTKQQHPKQFLKILNNSLFSDFAFIVKEKEFKVHKAILANASETIAKMFTSNFEESNQGYCVVDHIEPNVFECLLRFIYAGDIPIDLCDVSMELFKAAHYYGINNLMEICKEYIHFKLSAENALETYELASVYEITDLQIDAWKIVKTHVLKIFFPLNVEPLPVNDLRELINIKKLEKEFWLKHKKKLVAGMCK